MTKTGRWRRWAIGVLIAFALVMVWALWWLRDRPVPRLEGVVPTHGECLFLEIPRGFLDVEVQQVLESTHAHLMVPGGLLDGKSLPEEVGEMLPTALRTRPWRVAIWRGGAGGTLLVMGVGGLSGLVERADIPPRSFSLFGRDLRGALQDRVLVVSDLPEFVRSASEATSRAVLEPVSEEFRFRLRAQSERTVTGITEFLPLPPGAKVVEGTIVGGREDKWILRYRVQSPVAATSPWGLLEWKRLLERENIEVELDEASRDVQGGAFEGSWKLQGVRRATRQLVEMMDFWTEWSWDSEQRESGQHVPGK